MRTFPLHNLGPDKGQYLYYFPFAASHFALKRAWKDKLGLLKTRHIISKESDSLLFLLQPDEWPSITQLVQSTNLIRRPSSDLSGRV